MYHEKPWLKFYPPQVPASIDYPEVPITHFLKDAAVKLPEQVAIHFMGKEITYRQLLNFAYRFARYLQTLGVQKGDRVAIMLPNCPQGVISYYGSLLLGAVVVQTNPLYMERELLHQLTDSGAKVIVSLDLVYPKVEKVRDKVPLEHVIVTSIKDFLPFPKNILYPLIQKNIPKISFEPQKGIHSFVSIMKSVSNEAIEAEVDSNDLALLQYTGGTTGLPKGVMLTHRNLVVNVVQGRAWMYKSQYGKETILGVLPFFHVYGMSVVMNLAVYLASTMILVPKFDAGEILKIIETKKPTLFPGAPTMYIGIINHPDIKKYNLSSIEACLSGSAPLPIEVQERFEELTGGRLVEGYGLSETSPVTHANPIWDRRVNGSIGLPWPDTECKIVDPGNGEEIPVGGIGELAIRGPQVMKGYWNMPEETSAVMRDGWFLTGDMAYMDKDGYFYIVDRKKDMIIAGGFNIYPREVEEVLFEHPAVQEATVIGIPDPYRGETVKAFIVLKKGQSVSEEELNNFCRSKLASYKAPRIYEFREELPKTMVGKVLRRALLEEEKKKIEMKNDTTG
ncbi:long-chain-fatty-acid--CoA ligase [Microaerobacter geothermalis]|uniref:long-chain-fatty-acid--CoA ligase n=1 Tax=Microaerobacter geothermalis TaxID=674972 RepID=UPI001F3D1CAB|nr:long-chain-fatty-acid--CoA ligase [Microaerobacter geothermalis]MCF6092598.1 long-chain-fatty-acid--CoA ligase [Microaerobacter geothermalis]